MCIRDRDIPEYFRSIEALSAAEMHKKVTVEFPKNKIIFKAAAVADYTPAKKSEQKIKKTDSVVLELKRTRDILAELGNQKNGDQILIGFAAESENIIENARLKLQKKNLDFIAANNLKVSGQDETEIILISQNDEEKICGTKFEAAHKILDKIREKMHE